MRLLCCSDTHGRVPPRLNESGATAWLHAGDVESGPNVDESMRELDPVLDPLLAPVAHWFRTRPLPVYAVRGNHDCVDVHRAFDDGRDVSSRVVSLAPGVWLVGLGWHGERHFELPLESDLEPLIRTVDRLLLRLAHSRDAVVLLTHYPPLYDELRPRHSSDQPDSLAIRAFIDRVKPVVVVEGHVHRRAGEAFNVTHVDGTTTAVVNPGPDGCAIEVDLATRVAIVTPSFPPPRPGSARP